MSRRKNETIDRESWEAMLANLDGDEQDTLRGELLQWQGGDDCQQITVSLDSLGLLDSQSCPRPSNVDPPPGAQP